MPTADLASEVWKFVDLLSALSLEESSLQMTHIACNGRLRAIEHSERLSVAFQLLCRQVC